MALDGPLLSIAGPDSGKLPALAYRLRTRADEQGEAKLVTGELTELLGSRATNIVSQVAAHYRTSHHVTSIRKHLRDRTIPTSYGVASSDPAVKCGAGLDLSETGH